MANGGGNYKTLVRYFRNRERGFKNTEVFREYLTQRSPIYEDAGTRMVILPKKADKSSGFYLTNQIYLFGFSLLLLKLFQLE